MQSVGERMSNLTTSRLNTYMHDSSNMHTLPSDKKHAK